MSEDDQRQEVTGQLKAYFETEFPNPAGIELTETTDLLQDWFIDSFSLLHTTLYLEQHFGVEVRRADVTAENFSNISTLARYVVKRRTKA